MAGAAAALLQGRPPEEALAHGMVGSKILCMRAQTRVSFKLLATDSCWVGGCQCLLCRLNEPEHKWLRPACSGRWSMYSKASDGCLLPTLTGCSTCVRAKSSERAGGLRRYGRKAPGGTDLRGTENMGGRCGPSSACTLTSTSCKTAAILCLEMCSVSLEKVCTSRLTHLCCDLHM